MKINKKSQWNQMLEMTILTYFLACTQSAALIEQEIIRLK